MKRFLALALLVLPACGGAPFTVGYASLASGDDAQTTSPDAGEDSAPADPDAFLGEGGGALDGGGREEGSTHADGASPTDSGTEWDAGEASLPDGWIRSSDASDALVSRSDDAAVDSPADSPASAMPDAHADAPPALCCLTVAPCAEASIPVPLPSGYGGWSGTTAGSQCMPGVPGYGYCSGTVGVCP